MRLGLLERNGLVGSAGRRKLEVLVGAVLGASCPSVAVAGAWTQPEGALFVKGAWLQQVSDERLDCRGERIPGGPAGAEFFDRQLFFYGEYGWREGWTLVGSWALKEQRVRSQSAPDYGTRSTGDLRFGVRRSLRQGSTAFALEVVGSVPTYPRAQLDRPPGEREQVLPVGTGEPEAEFRVQLGRSLHPLALYGNLDLGYRWRGGDFGNQVIGAGEVGSGGTWLFAKLELRWILASGDECRGIGVGNVATETRSVQLSPELGVRVGGPWWLQLGLAHTLSGRNTLPGMQWTFGLALLESN